MKLVLLGVNIIGFIAGLMWVFPSALFHPTAPWTLWTALPPWLLGFRP